MQITDVRIRKVEKEGKMKAVVSITIDEEFVVHDIKIIEGEKGLFIAMPSRVSGNNGCGRIRTADERAAMGIAARFLLMLMRKIYAFMQK